MPARWNPTGGCARSSSVPTRGCVSKVGQTMTSRTRTIASGLGWPTNRGSCAEVMARSVKNASLNAAAMRPASTRTASERPLPTWNCYESTRRQCANGDPPRRARRQQSDRARRSAPTRTTNSYLACSHVFRTRGAIRTPAGSARATTNAGPSPKPDARPARRHVRNRRDRGGTRGRRAPCPPRNGGRTPSTVRCPGNYESGSAEPGAATLVSPLRARKSRRSMRIAATVMKSSVSMASAASSRMPTPRVSGS
jgi:hypothetical protein